MFEALFLDRKLLVINKEAGVAVQGDDSGDVCLLELAKAWLKEQEQKPGAVFLAPAHRLDRPVSGAVVFARTSKAAARMQQAFLGHEVRKTYLAVVHGETSWADTLLECRLVKDRERNVVKAVHSGSEGQPASTLATTIVNAGGLSMVSLKPLTGRSHQLRVHVSMEGHPIVGDLKYGSNQGLGHMILLHAWRLEFTHPFTAAPLDLTAPVPRSWSAFLPQAMSR